MNALEQLTVCITNFQRPELLDRAIGSVKKAGVRRLTIASVMPDSRVVEVIERWRKSDWLSYDVAVVNRDIGCNDTWMLAAYRSRTKRIIILHDDDLLRSNFGQAYESIIAPRLDDGIGFATWRAELYFMDGSVGGTEFRSGETGEFPSSELAKTVNHYGRLSLSPVISVLDRETVIHACKESKQELTRPECYERPGMLLGTEIVVYMRHIQKFSRWLWVNEVLSQYGSHAGSGTIKHQSSGDLSQLTRGYDLARAQAAKPVPEYVSSVIFVHSVDDVGDGEERERIRVAQLTWQHHFDTAKFIELPVLKTDLGRTGLDVGDTRAVPFVRDLFDLGCRQAMPEDVVVYCNRDIGLTAPAYPRLMAGVRRGNGVTVCPRRRLNPEPGKMYETLEGTGVDGTGADGGFDVMAVTPGWWKNSRILFPDLLIGREAWDTVFRMLAESWSDGVNRPIEQSMFMEQWHASKAYTDDVCWHKWHVGGWERDRFVNLGQQHNRALAAEFFKKRGDHKLVWVLSNVQGLAPHVIAEARQKVEAPVRRIVLAMQFWEGDKEAAMRNIRRIVDNESVFRNDFEVMFVARRDCSHDVDTVNYAARRFPTTTYTCSGRAQGWPNGSNEVWCETMQESLRRVKSGQWAQVRALLTFEADCVPVNRGWLHRLTEEWTATEKAQCWLTGWWNAQYSPVGHMNGNMLVHPKLSQFFPRIAGASCNRAWDQEFAPTFAPRWRKAGFLENLYGEKNVTEERIRHIIAQGAVLIHGVKDRSVEDFADSLLKG